MKTIKTVFFILILIIPLFSFSQVGIGTTTPDASSVLDVAAIDKGILIPRVSLANINTTMLDGTNTAATGLLIYNTNAAVIGGNGIGYYYYNGTIWEQLKTSSSISDHDFYEEGTTIAPDDINDDIYTYGNMAIGKSTADYALDVEETINDRATNIFLNSTSTASFVKGQQITNSSINGNSTVGTSYLLDGNGTSHKFGIRTDIINGVDGNHIGLYNNVSAGNSGSRFGVSNGIGGSGDDLHVGVANRLNGLGNGPKYGTISEFPSSGDGILTGSFVNINNFGNGNRFGFDSNIGGDGNGVHYGSRNRLHGNGVGSKYGSYNYISSIAGGTHYGVYSLVLKSGNNYAGYFLGNVSIGTTTSNNYILPPSRGTANQIMQTDATGNVSWVDSAALGLDDHDWYEEGTTSAPNDINDDMFTQGNVAIGKTTADCALDIVKVDANRVINVLLSGDGGTFKAGITSTVNNTGSLTRYGFHNSLAGAGTGFKFGIYNRLFDDDSAGQTGIENEFSGISSSNQIGLKNRYINSVNTGDHFGVYTVNPTDGSGDHYGVYNGLGGSGDGIICGSYNRVINLGNGNHFGTYNEVIGDISGTDFGDKTGSYNLIHTAAGGQHYGVYSEVLKPSGFAGYFLGNVSIGTTITNNYILPSSRGTANQIMQTDGSGQLSWVNSSDLVNASNGLTVNTNDIILGGTLTQATTISQGTNNLTFNLNNSGDFNIEGNTEPNLLYADGGNDRIGVLTNTPEFNIHIDQPNTFVGGSSGMGFSSGANNWKIYHSGLHFSFVENGVRRAYVTGGTGDYVVTSDRRLKKSITEVESILDKVSQLKTYRYLYKDQEDSAKKTLGFMAQDIQPLFPELVGQAEDGYFGLNYAGFGVVAVKAIQEQQEIIESQQTTIQGLLESQEETNALLNQLLKRIESLESKN